MTPETRAFILGVVGIGATLLTALGGLYFTTKARRAPLRELLYARQLPLVVSFLRLAGRARVYGTILADEVSPYHDRARSDMATVAKHLSELEDRAAALLPVEVFTAIRATSRSVDALVEAKDQGLPVGQKLRLLIGNMARAALLVRTLLGVEELSHETMGLFTKASSLEKIDKVRPEDLVPDENG